MSSSDPVYDSSKRRLAEIRQTLLDLHKALLDSERTAYEITHGPIASPSAFLQMLINDPSFAWLRPITALVVQIDETLAAKKPPAVAQDFDRLVTDTGAFLSPSSEANGFWQRYQTALDRDPAIAILHVQLCKQLSQK